MKTPLRRLLTFPLILLAALVILFEDYVWAKVTALAAIVARWRLVARLEGWVLRRGRRTTLALFAVPIACLIPLKLTAVYLIASGHAVTGVLVIIAAKLTGTAISARLYAIAQPKLMTFETFVWMRAKVLRFNAWAHTVIDRLKAREAIARVKAALRRVRSESGGARIFLLSRLNAARRFLRRPS